MPHVTQNTTPVCLVSLEFSLQALRWQIFLLSSQSVDYGHSVWP